MSVTPIPQPITSSDFVINRDRFRSIIGRYAKEFDLCEKGINKFCDELGIDSPDRQCTVTVNIGLELTLHGTFDSYEFERHLRNELTFMSGYEDVEVNGISVDDVEEDWKVEG